MCTKIDLNCRLANKKTWLLALKVGFLSSGKKQRTFLHKNIEPLPGRLVYFGASKWSPIPCLGAPKWPSRHHVKTHDLYDHSWIPKRMLTSLNAGLFVHFFILDSLSWSATETRTTGWMLPPVNWRPSNTLTRICKWNLPKSISSQVSFFLRFSEVDSKSPTTKRTSEICIFNIEKRKSVLYDLLYELFS